MSRLITLDFARRVLDRYGEGVLHKGGHLPPKDPLHCQMCVEELRFLCLVVDEETLELSDDWKDRWTDVPDSGTNVEFVCQSINDLPWTTADRLRYCLPLVECSEADAHPDWVERFYELTIRYAIPYIAKGDTRLDEKTKATIQDICRHGGTIESLRHAKQHCTSLYSTTILAINTFMLCEKNPYLCGIDAVFAPQVTERGFCLLILSLFWAAYRNTPWILRPH